MTASLRKTGGDGGRGDGRMIRMSQYAIAQLPAVAGAMAAALFSSAVAAAAAAFAALDGARS